jgi:hypothetical protein
MGLSSPQALDTQRLAAKYNADPIKGTTLVRGRESASSLKTAVLSSDPVLF